MANDSSSIKLLCYIKWFLTCSNKKCNQFMIIIIIVTQKLTELYNETSQSDEWEILDYIISIKCLTKAHKKNREIRESKKYKRWHVKTWYKVKTCFFFVSCVRQLLWWFLSKNYKNNTKCLSFLSCFFFNLWRGICMRNTLSYKRAGSFTRDNNVRCFS